MLLLEYRMEETASAISEIYRSGYSLGPEASKRIHGYAVYSWSGIRLLSTGKVPASLNTDWSYERTAIFSPDYKEGAITMVWRIGFVPPTLGSHESLRRMLELVQRGTNAPAFIYLRLDAGRELKMQRVYTGASVGVPIVFALILSFIGLLSNRNWNYKRRIEGQQHLVQLGQAARTLSHEIRNPLSAIQIQTGILRKTLSQDRHTGIAVIEEEVERLRLLVERIGEFIRNPAGTQEPVELRGFITDLIGFYEWNVVFKFASEENLYVKFDRDRLRSLLENLVRNARESAERETSVEIGVGAAGKKIEISVADDGDGLATDQIERLFDPFYTTKDKGSGVGLAISKRFVEAAEGSLTLKPRKEGGTVATVLLPRVLVLAEKTD